LEAAVVGDGADLTSGPAAFAEVAELLFHVSVDGDGAEGVGSDLL
jgi:hypothetical protein